VAQFQSFQSTVNRSDLWACRKQPTKRKDQAPTTSALIRAALRLHQLARWSKASATNQHPDPPRLDLRVAEKRKRDHQEQPASASTSFRTSTHKTTTRPPSFARVRPRRTEPTHRAILHPSESVTSQNAWHISSRGRAKRSGPHLSPWSHCGSPALNPAEKSITALLAVGRVPRARRFSV
jgi:hypothetical protein